MEHQRRFDEAIWQCEFFLPNTVVCSKHRCWLAIWVFGDPERVFLADDALARKPHVPPFSRRPPQSLFDLAALDRAVLRTDIRADFAGAYVGSLVLRHQGRLSKKAYSPRPSLEVDLRRILGPTTEHFFTVRGVPLPTMRLDLAATFLRNKKLGAGHAVLVGWLAGLDAETWDQQTALRVGKRWNNRLELCGSRFCWKRSLDWQEKMWAALSPQTNAVHAFCSMCNFQALVESGSGRLRVTRQGDASNEVRKSLLTDRYMHRDDVARVLGVSPHQVNALQHQYRKWGTIASTSPLLRSRPRGSRMRRPTHESSGSVDGPAFVR
jgi:hypothetical protein